MTDLVELWDIPSAILRHRIECEFVSAVGISCDGKLLAASGGGDIRIWDTDTGRQEHLLAGGERHQTPRSLAFGPDNSWLVCGADGVVRLYRLDSQSSEPGGSREICYKDLKASSLLVLSNGVIVLFRESCVEAWDQLEHCVWKIDISNHVRLPGHRRKEVFVDADETRMVLGLNQGRLGIWSLEDGVLLRIVSLDIPRYGSVADLLENADLSIPFWGNTMWRAPGGPYFHIPGVLYGGAVHLPQSVDGQFTLIDCDGQVKMVALDGRGGVARQMPFRGYAKAFCISDDRLLALNRNGELFLQEFTD